MCEIEWRGCIGDRAACSAAAPSSKEDCHVCVGASGGGMGNKEHCIDVGFVWVTYVCVGEDVDAGQY